MYDPFLSGLLVIILISFLAVYNTAASDDLPHSEDVAPSLDTVAQSIVPGHSTHSISEPASRSVINMIVTEEVHVEAGRFTTGLAKGAQSTEVAFDLMELAI